MFEVSQAFHRARRIRNQRPVVLLVLKNAFGLRAYAGRHPSRDELGLVAPAQADGVFLADGARRAGEGSLELLERGGRVLSLGRVRETLAPGGEVLASLRQEEAGGLTVSLSNGGDRRAFSRLEARENLLGAVGEITVGWPGLRAREYLRRFSGRVTAYRMESETLTLTLRAL
ncbi:MAG: hypothetical protein K9K66_14160 [Desulfarculaceae bacterium]|nr:hypothetical protein [Desulfarculaceae bacterium]MCF8073816.1 hypothetical protein [Desulfarculaceae bacterium]MCF8102796.1 hypothetical protein [Desulfarculaceae bacterium]MCF8116240.1 hypothetical protein [Desulfarculaceae bacterium]